jgi:two-component system sensor histidine kinase MprB
VSLRARMGLAAGVAVAIAVIAVAFFAYAGTRSQLTGSVDNQLRQLTGDVLHRGPGGPAGENRDGGQLLGGNPAAVGEPPGFGDEGLNLEHRGPGFGGAAGVITLVYANGKTYVPPTQSYTIPVDSRMRALAKSGDGSYFTQTTASGTHIRVHVTGIGNRGAIAVALPLTEIDKTLHNQLLLLAIISAAGVALAAVLGFLVARTAIAPITRFTRQTEVIAANPERIEHDRLEVHGNDELARLGRTFNTTLDALEAAMASQRNLVADASHELRTPIASIRANLQLMRDESLLAPADREALRADMIEELDELTGLVGDVVELARGSKPSGELGDVRLDQLLAQALDRVRRRAPQLHIEASIEETLVRGEPDRIGRAVANLLDNAMKWSPPDGTVEATLRDGTLTIRDHGPGFHEEDLPFVFDRFHRAKDARSKPGSGLGLAIVQQIVTRHDGSVWATNRPGGGAAVGFELPAAPATPTAAPAPGAPSSS